MRLLIIGINETKVSTAVSIAVKLGAKVHYVDSIDKAVKFMLNAMGAEMILCDIKFNIKELINKLNTNLITTSVIGYGDNNVEPNHAAQAIKDGAQEYISLPPDVDIIATIINSITNNDEHYYQYEDAAMQPVMEMAKKIADSKASVLITGESGVGKEVIAKFIHNHSKLKNNPLLGINCAAIPEQMLESELFGHEKGSFTGAINKRIGKFEEANNSTLLLDEISEMDIKLQSKLLRVIQEREICRIGSNKSIPIDVRIIATANRNMQEEIKKGKFREDLFFRLNVINLHIPPLKQRPKDIINLANVFVKKYAKLNAVPVLKINQDTVNILTQHNWPGNVRELENTMHRAVLLSKNETTIQTQHIMIDAINHQTNLNNNNDNQENKAERNCIVNTISYTMGDKLHAANILGISINKLTKKLNNYIQQGYIAENDLAENYQKAKKIYQHSS